MNINLTLELCFEQERVRRVQAKQDLGRAHRSHGFGIRVLVQGLGAATARVSVRMSRDRDRDRDAYSNRMHWHRGRLRLCFGTGFWATLSTYLSMDAREKLRPIHILNSKQNGGHAR